jgi:hypothetical protein
MALTILPASVPIKKRFRGFFLMPDERTYRVVGNLPERWIKRRGCKLKKYCRTCVPLLPNRLS